MRGVEAWSIGLLLEAGEPGDWAALFDRVGDALASAVPHGGAHCVDAALADGRPAYLKAIVDDRKSPQMRQKALERLADLGHPVDQYFFQRTLAEPRLQRRLLAASTLTDPKWDMRWSGLLPWLLGTQNRDARPAVVCSHPEVLRHVLEALGPELTRAEQLRGLASLYEHAGADEVLAVLRSAALSADVVETAREAAGAPDGESRLRDAAQEAESTAALIDELYRVESGKKRPRGGGPKGSLLSAADLIGARTELDWDALLAAHRNKPFVKESTVLPLAQRSDCPPRMLAAFLAVPPKVTGAARWSQTVAGGAVSSGLSGADLLEIGRPAKGILALSLGAKDEPGWVEYRSALKTLVRDRLGADVPAWRAVRVLLAEHTGTVAELIDQALAAPAVSEDEPWPQAAGLPEMNRSVGELPIVRAAFVTLLDAADTEAQAAVLRRLDDQSAHDLLVAGAWKPRLAEYIVTAGSPRERLVLARRDLSEEWFDRLLVWEEPELRTSVFFRNAAASRNKRRIATGGSADAARAGRVPMPPQVRESMLNKEGHGWTTDFALVCGDPEVLRDVMRYYKAGAGHRALRMFAALWRRHGPDEVRALLAHDLSATRSRQFEPRLKTLLETLLALPDEAAALERLRAHALVAVLRTGDLGEDVIDVELPTWDWDTVLTAHRELAFASHDVRRLAARPGCPAELTEGLEPAAEPSADWARAVAEKPADDVLAEMKRSPGPATERQRALADALAPIKGNLEAWALMLRMLPTFPGTLPELVSTAERAVW